MARDPETSAHQEWIGFVQPVGLVVSIPALLAAGVIVNRNIAPIHQRFLLCLRKDKFDEPISELADFRKLVEAVLEWESGDLVRLPENVETTEYSRLEIAVPEYGEVLRPTFVIPEFKPKEGQSPWIMLVQELDDMTTFDEVSETDRHKWQATPHAKFERLLRETEVPIGLLVNQTHMRLIYAPRGETSGYITFEFANMIPVAGRPILGALYMLLSNDRLFRLGEKERLPALLTESRKYQNTVSTKLAEQVLDALYELLRGFQGANEQSHGQLLGEILDDEPDQVYAGLLTVLMRLVFIMYAEDRNLLSSSPVYTNFYSVSGLFERLREDEGRFPDTMEHRFGGWSQLLSLFRIIFDGASHDELTIPQRKGHLFDPDRYPFLEGRMNQSDIFPLKETIPHVSDGVVYRVLRNLLILDGERLSYRTLDVEQIGSVYEAIMGFRLVIAEGNSIAIRPKKAHGAPVNINLDELLTTKPNDRAKWIRERSDQDVTGVALEELKRASTVADLLVALEKKIAQHATPHLVPPGNMILQPSDERRNSGSHYTPRLLTEPIVRRTLSPIFERLGASSTPQQILDLKVCDPAMGSGAFLVETCRQLGDELVKAWQRTNSLPTIPPDEDEVLHARRLIAQRCLYGVDRNPMAVDLAKLSLWLATLAKDHPFTFLDHTLRPGDSLVGLTKDHIMRFHWDSSAQRVIDEKRIKRCIEKATAYRKEILENADNYLYPILQVKLSESDKELEIVREIGDAAIVAFFSCDNERLREQRRCQLLPMVSVMLSDPHENDSLAHSDFSNAVAELRSGVHPLKPFHWHVEFPEVFERHNPGFDAIVGNPPFAGKNTYIGAHPTGYLDWLQTIHSDSHGNADIVAHFFRRSFHMLRQGGSFGLIATNTIGQGDTRSTGLRWICQHEGVIFAARKRCRWPGQAAVVVSIVHVHRGTLKGLYQLDNRDVPAISSYLFQSSRDEEPFKLQTNIGKCYQGSIPLGLGFMFDDEDKTGVSQSLAQMEKLIQDDVNNATIIQPFIGGAEVCESPTQAHRRYVINFGERSLEQAERWPALLAILKERVKPERDKDKRAVRRERWWQFAEKQTALYRSIVGMNRVLVCPKISTNLNFAFMPTNLVFSQMLICFVMDSDAYFAGLQSRCHEVWARTFGSTMKDDLSYLSSCFETFPFPESLEANEQLTVIGRAYYSYRSDLMIASNQGLTKTYNRFHDPDETSVEIVKLRALHDKMDELVLSAYGWNDLVPKSEFILDYQQDDELSPDETSARRTRKKPWRLRWTDEFQDEIIARLLELNSQRAEKESLMGAASPQKQKSTKGKSHKIKESPETKVPPQQADQQSATQLLMKLET